MRDRGKGVNSFNSSVGEEQIRETGIWRAERQADEGEVQTPGDTNQTRLGDEH